MESRRLPHETKLIIADSKAEPKRAGVIRQPIRLSAVLLFPFHTVCMYSDRLSGTTTPTTALSLMGVFASRRTSAPSVTSSSRSTSR
jgi:hypothetical protein